MIKYAIKQMSNSRSQSILLILAALIPLLGNLLDQLLLVLVGFFSFTAFSLSLSVVLFGVVTFKYRFLNIIPVAWQKIMKHLNESMLIIDWANTVVNYNHSFKNNFPEFVQARSDDLKTFTDQLRSRCEDPSEGAQMINAIQHGATGELSGELTLIFPEWKCFSVHIQSILSKRGEIQGRIIIFNDITNDKKLIRELAAANEQLKDYARTVEKLAAAQERIRIARDIHDSVGHNMTLLIALLEVGINLYEQNSTETRSKLVEATGVAREGLRELRRSIRHQTGIHDLLESLHKLIDNFETSEIQIDLSVEGMNDHLQPQYSEVIYRICQEALTNAMRHGKAKQATLILRFGDKTINLYIFDNGHGCKTITKGMGLTGMEERVKELNGTIEYGSSGEGGFNINVEIPM